MAIKPVTLAEITVASAGTRQQVSATTVYVTSVVFQAATGNSGKIIVGDSNVSSTRGITLAADASTSFTADHSGRAGAEEFNLSDFWVDTTSSGDKVHVSYITRK